MNKEVNFEIAKLLQEKGFDEPCRFGYNGSFEPYNIGLIEFNYLQQNSELLELTYSAPTIAEVVMWLYEKHGIWIAVTKYKDHAADVNDPYYFTYNGGQHIFKTPVKAYELAIKYTLENLI